MLPIVLQLSCVVTHSSSMNEALNPSLRLMWNATIKAHSSKDVFLEYLNTQKPRNSVSGYVTFPVPATSHFS